MCVCVMCLCVCGGLTSEACHYIIPNLKKTHKYLTTTRVYFGLCVCVIIYLLSLLSVGTLEIVSIINLLFYCLGINRIYKNKINKYINT